MRRTLVGLGLALLAHAEAASHMRVWSPHDGFLSAVSHEAEVRADLSDKSKLREWVGGRFAPKGAAQPGTEVMVVFSLTGSENIATSLAGVPELQSQISRAPSSVVVPYLQSSVDDVQGMFPRSFRTSSPSEAETLLQSGSVPTADGVCDAVVVELSPATASQDGPRIAELIKKVGQLTAGKYACAVVVESGVQLPQEYLSVFASRPESQHRRLASSSSSPTKYVYMTPDLLAGILTGILLVVIVIIGIGCLSSIQTPSQFADAPPPSTKDDY